MNETDSLYNLIKSLTKTEKAYFKKYAKRHVIGGQNKYALLFDAIDSFSNGYDEQQIRNKFRNEGFVKNFPVMKKYLMETLLKSLGSLYAATNPGSEIKNEIIYIEILYKKGMFGSCAKILDKLLKQAYKRDNFLLILELLKWKKNLIHENAFNGNNFSNLEKAYNEEQEIIAKIKNLSDYRMLSYRTRKLVVGTNPPGSAGEIKRELNEILNHPLLKSEKQALSYPAVVTYFHTLADLYDNLKKDNEAFQCRKRLIKVMEEHPNYINEYVTNYIVSICNIMGTCLALKLYTELEYYIAKLRALEKTYPKKIFYNDRLFILLAPSIYELRMRIGKGEFGMGIQNIVEIEKGLKEFGKKVLKEDGLHFFYLIAYGYFGAGKFNEALIWINKILNERDIDRNSRLYVKSKIFNLIIHFELENFDLLDYLIRSTYRFFEKSSYLGREEKIIVRFLRRLSDDSGMVQLRASFEEFLRLIKTAPHASTDKSSEADPVIPLSGQTNFTSLVEFDLESWLESKISEKKFADVIKEKYTKSVQ
jgi:hypothetical protein